MRILYDLFLFLLLISEYYSRIRNKLKNSKTKSNMITNANIIQLKKVSSSNIHTHDFISMIQKSLLENTYNRYIISNFIDESTNTDSLTKIIELKNFKNSQYIGNIFLGDPIQQFPVIFDTGSGNLLVTSSLCNNCLNSFIYNHKKSKNFKYIGLEVEVTFGTGIVSAIINEDSFFMGKIKVPNQKFAEIINERGEVFKECKFSGILGLGYPDLAADGIIPVFDTIISKKLLSNNLFAFYYSYNEATGGEISFGEINPKLFEGEIKYYPVINKHYWTINLIDILFNGKSLGLCLAPCKAIIDSGTSLITGPTNNIRYLLIKLPVDKNCVGYNPLDQLEFIFENSGDKYTLNADEFVTKEKINGKITCSTNFMPMDVPIPHGPAWILGAVFMQKYYTVFDRDNDRIGFARAKHSEKKEN